MLLQGNSDAPYLHVHRSISSSSTSRTTSTNPRAIAITGGSLSLRTLYNMATQQLHPRERHRVERALLTSTEYHADARLPLDILSIPWNTSASDASVFLVTI